MERHKKWSNGGLWVLYLSNFLTPRSIASFPSSCVSWRWYLFVRNVDFICWAICHTFFKKSNKFLWRRIEVIINNECVDDDDDDDRFCHQHTENKTVYNFHWDSTTIFMTSYTNMICLFWKSANLTKYVKYLLVAN